jgi:hypothetical protein
MPFQLEQAEGCVSEKEKNDAIRFKEPDRPFLG